MKVVVILPTYNERENIITLLTSLHQCLGKSKHIIEYLIVDDSSPDGTAELVVAYQKMHPDVRVITGKKEGLGRALLRGMIYAVDTRNADIVVQMDADLSHDPIALPRFLEEIDHGADFVVGSRYIPGGSIPENWGVHRKIFSILGNAVVRFGLGYLSIHDWTGGFRAYKKSFVESARNKLRSYSGYVFQIAFLHMAVVQQAKVREVAIHFTDRKFGHSKIAPAQYIKNVFEYVIRARIHQIVHGSFGKFLMVGTIAFIINTVLLEFFVYFGLHPTFGSIIGAEIAMIANFLMNNAWTFKSKKISGWRRILKFLQFNTTSLGAIAIQAGMIALGTSVAGVSSYRWFYILGVGIGLFYNYIMYTKVIWKTHE